MKWVLAECDEAAVAALSSEGGMHPLVARLLVNRGITDSSAAQAFLACDLSVLSAPSVFAGMDSAVNRVREAISAHQKIVIYGDYDVDGVTAAALLFLILKRLGAVVDCYIPDRISEGYGLNAGALQKIGSSGARLVITVDCGITASREAQIGRSLGLDIIITDHHEIAHSNDPDAQNCSVRFALPEAFSILHPCILQPGLSDTVREQVSSLTGVGVVFKLAQALLGPDHCDPGFQSYLDLVALGTVADVGRITGENRLLVKHGLDLLSLEGAGQRPGIAALKQIAGLNGKKIGVGAVGFTLAPRINASGRLERADTAFRLLTTDSPDEARMLASALDEVNRARQAVEERIQEEARGLCRRQKLESTGAFVLSSQEWHPGVIGIVASRLVEEFFRPAALICVKDGIGKGSARSIPGFDLYQGLERCEDLLLGFGGHKYAAGFSLAEERIPAFRERLASIVREQAGPDGFRRTLIVDTAVTFDELSLELLREIDKLAPFGQGNPEPRFGARDLEVVSSRIVGNNHLKLSLRQQNGTVLGAIAFNRGSLLGKLVRQGARLAAVFTPRLNAWNGSVSVELEIRDIKIDKEHSKSQTTNSK